MSKHFCKVSLVGQIFAITSFPDGYGNRDMIVVTRRPEKINGGWIEMSEQHTVRVNGANSDYVLRFGKPGAVIAVDGDLRYEDFDSLDGDPVAYIMCERVTLLDPSPEAVEFKREIG